MEKNKTRQTELDILRIVALLAVITVHCSGMGTKDLSMMDKGHKIIIFIDSIITWQVPIYVMISGRFFLDPEREVNLQKILKAIGRLLIAFVVWDCIYLVFYIITGEYTGMNWKGILAQALIGPYHFWYLYMAIGLYLIIPFLRMITKSKKLMEYFILLFIVFEFTSGYGISFPVVGSIIAEIMTKMSFHFAMGYSGYYVLGYYLYKYKVSDKNGNLLYLLGVILALIAGVVTVNRVAIEGVNNEWHTKYLLPNVALEAAALYTFFIKKGGNCRFSKTITEWMHRLSEYSFGVYLVHALIVSLIGRMGILVAGRFVILKLLTIVIFVFVFSNIVVWLIRKIPYIGKKIT